VIYDVVVVGGGPAGLSAALLLGRARRSVVVCDTGRPRNARSSALHGFLTRDGISPSEFLRLARKELLRYPTVEIRALEVTGACAREGGFETVGVDDTRLRSRKLLLATGRVDDLPPIPGLAELYGNGVFHCPYCDGYELSDQALVAYGRGAEGRKLALSLRSWSNNIVLCTDGPSLLSFQDRERLRRHRIELREERITEVTGAADALDAVVFESGERYPCQALFVKAHQRQCGDLYHQLGCRITRTGDVLTRRFEATNIPGLYVAGDSSQGLQLAIVAAAKGAQAAFSINTELLKEALT
jgi:thioredoxin reductase